MRTHMRFEMCTEIMNLFVMSIEQDGLQKTQERGSWVNPKVACRARQMSSALDAFDPKTKLKKIYI